MNFKKLNILLGVSVGTIFALSACKKDDGAIPKRISITDLPTITTNVDPTGSSTINILTPATAAAFSGKFKADLYFPGTTPPSKIDIVVRKNNLNPITNPNATVTNSNIKLFKAGVTAFPANLTVSAAEIAALFGTPIVTFDAYDFAPDIYVGDRKFEAFPAVGNGTGAGLNGQPFFAEFSRFNAYCQDTNFHQGNFEVVSDAFPNGFTPGQVVVLTKISSTRFSFSGPNVTGSLPINVNINTTTNVLTTTTNILSTTKQKIGNAFTWDATQTNPNVTVTAGATNFIDPCAKTIDLNITYSTDQKLFQIALLRLRKL
jgi:hypothetical protein